MNEITREELLELVCLTSATDDWVKNKIIDELVKEFESQLNQKPAEHIGGRI